MDSDLILQSNIEPSPEEITSTLLDVEYPIPGWITFTSIIFPSEIMDLSCAPVPDPVGSTTSNLGVEKYSNPPNWRFVFVIEPFTIIGFTWPSFPFLTVNKGFFWTFSIEDPYPVPVSYR